MEPQAEIEGTPDRRRRDRAPAWILAVLLLGLAGWRVARTTRFMLDADRQDLAVDAFSQRHWCATAYLIAADLALAHAPRPYDPEHYRADANERRSGTLPGELGRRFDIDSYPYPPQFLLVPAALLTATREPLKLRAAWYVLVLAILGAAALVSAARLPQRALALVALPAALLVSHPVQQSLQVGNVQPLVVATSVLAAIAFAAGRAALGGPLLALAILTKIWPAALLLLAVAQRRWRDVAWTMAWILLLTLLTLAWFGSGPFQEFLGFELRWIADGRAFPFLADPRLAADSLSIPTLAHKLHALGIVAAPTVLVSQPLSVAYGSLLLALLLVAGLGQRDAARSPRRMLRLSLATLALAQLGSPYLASSLGLIAPLWLLLGLCDPDEPRRSLAAVALILAFALPLPDDVLLRSLSTLAQILSILVLGAAVLLKKETPRRSAATGGASEPLAPPRPELDRG